MTTPPTETPATTPQSTATPAPTAAGKDKGGMALSLSLLALSETNDDFDRCLSPKINKVIGNSLLDQCAFLDRTFRRFTKEIDGGNYVYLPTLSYQYAFKAMEQYRATYSALQLAEQEWKRLALLEQKINFDAKGDA